MEPVATSAKAMTERKVSSTCGSAGAAARVRGEGEGWEVGFECCGGCGGRRRWWSVEG